MRMDYREHIQRALDCIEENLKNELSNFALAQAVGYLEYYFLRVFKETVHLTPADYIRKRHISEIARRMADQEQSIAVLAFEYGFNSKENFIRAFKAEHRILPTDFKTVRNSLKLYDRVTLEAPPFQVSAQVMTLKPFRLVVYKSDEASPPHFWNRYNTQKMSKNLLTGKR